MSDFGGHPAVWVIIPVRNRWDLTKTCLGSLVGQTYSAYSVVVIDDGSTDGTAEHLAQEFPEVAVLSGDGELWWTGATALGVGWVLEQCSQDDFVLTLNNDTTVDPDYIEVLLGVAAARHRRALIGSVAVDNRDCDTIVDGGPHINWVTAKGGSHHSGESLQTVRGDGIAHTEPDLLPGRGTLIPVRCIREIGSFDAKRLPHYGADYEFSARARRAGYGLVMSYEAPVYSEVEATGVTTKHGRLSWREFVKMFASRRSPACLLYRWRFAILSAPRHLAPIFLVMDTARVLLGGLRDQLRHQRLGKSGGD
ncbi:glycosyltransferase family 2 protein [Anaerosoma tenue]|uniref:glycosyltransferase family 2 protein n=1 Tax=Anaerosoma tenue TaxID=2933588 RepID=UPI002260C0D6|nr:glycosyltransferase family 2 protein [Anaerosoma tenue]MCK8114081.1 glycosyltransferase family 2 protein [Anaerosoma tenue]